jgi:hypothetical protein
MNVGAGFLTCPFFMWHFETSPPKRKKDLTCKGNNIYSLSTAIHEHEKLEAGQFARALVKINHQNKHRPFMRNNIRHHAKRIELHKSLKRLEYGNIYR